MPVTPMGWASEGGGESDKSFDIQELNTQARICTHLNLVRAEGRWSSASKRKGAGGGQKAGETDGAGLYRHTTGLPSLALLHMCTPKPVCAGSLLQRVEFLEVRGGYCMGIRNDGLYMLESQVTRTIAGGIGKPCNLFETLFGNF